MIELFANHIYPLGVRISKKNEAKGKAYKDKKPWETLSEVLLQFGRPVIPKKSFAEANKSLTTSMDPYVPPKRCREILTELEALSEKERERFGDANLEAILRRVCDFRDKLIEKLDYRRIRAFVKDYLSNRQEDQGAETLQGTLNDVSTLAEPEANVLYYLNGEFPRIRYQTDIEAACKRKRKTVMPILKKLA